MFDPEFFPTPLSLVKRMIDPYRDSAHHGLYVLPPSWTILEPSAGKGDIADYICSYHDRGYGEKRNHARIRVIEKNFDLQKILMAKGYPILGYDFLSYQADQHFDLIAMNPPFSNGDLHLLHAWDVVGSGGNIVCILNAETINNPCTKRRKDLLDLIHEHGSIEFVKRPFATAERKTNVEIAIVRLSKPKQDNDPLDFHFDIVDEKEDVLDASIESSESGALTQIDHLGASIRLYEKTRNAFVNFMRSMEELSFYGSELAEKYCPEGCSGLGLEHIHQMALSSFSGGGSTQMRCNDFRDQLNMSAWKKILSGLNLDGIMTSGVKRSLEDNIEKAGHLPLTKANISAVVQAIIGNAGDTMKKAVVDVFDLFTRYHEFNRVANAEGWKTNKSWYCGKKVILPNWVEPDWSKNGMHINFSRAKDYEDIDKACCWLTGKRYSDISTIEASMQADMHGPKEMKGESEFFFFRYFIKGTVHLTFKSQDVLDAFNRTANENKNWLGETR